MFNIFIVDACLTITLVARMFHGLTHGFKLVLILCNIFDYLCNFE